MSRGDEEQRGRLWPSREGSAGWLSEEPAEDGCGHPAGWPPTWGRYRERGLGPEIITHDKFALVSRAARGNVQPRKSSSLGTLWKVTRHTVGPIRLREVTLNRKGWILDTEPSPVSDGHFLEGQHAPVTERLWPPTTGGRYQKG